MKDAEMDIETLQGIVKDKKYMVRNVQYKSKEEFQSSTLYNKIVNFIFDAVELGQECVDIVFDPKDERTKQIVFETFEEFGFAVKFGETNNIPVLAFDDGDNGMAQKEDILEYFGHILPGAQFTDPDKALEIVNSALEQMFLDFGAQPTINISWGGMTYEMYKKFTE